MEKSKPKSRSRQRASLPRVLVVDANPGYRSVISHLVEMAGGQFESVAELAQARRQLDGSRSFDMLIVGASAGSQVSPEELSRLRTAAQSPLILLVESYDAAAETLDSYEAGADQVLPKPFVPDALIGAIKSELRRPGPASLIPIATRIELAGLSFDAGQRTVAGKEASVHMTKREWQLLTFFLASPNQFFAADEVALQAWGPEASVEQFRSYVTRLRQKLSPFSAYCDLVTEKGRGYCLVLEQPAAKEA